MSIAQYGAEYVLNTMGVPQPNALIKVLNLDNSLATLYTDLLGTPGPNPVSTDAYGNLLFFAVPGQYKLTTGSGGVTELISVKPEAGSPGPIVESQVTNLVSDLAAKATSASVTAETTRATAAEGANTTAIATNATAITTETTRATAAEALKATTVALTAETTRATGAEGANTTAIAAKAALLGVAATVTAAGPLVINKHNPVDATAGPLTMTLPTGQLQGSIIIAEKYDATTNAVTISGNIRGVPASTDVLVLPHQTTMFEADAAGSYWPVASHKALATLDGRYAGLAVANTLTQKQTLAVGGGVQSPALLVGTGTARGAPTGTITAVTNGGGAITSTTPGRKWAYTEVGDGGETPLSPASTALSLTAQRAKLTVPPIRPGMQDRVVYGSDDNGATWHKLGLFNSTGYVYFGSVYLDNNAALAGVAAPTVDTTAHSTLVAQNDGMVYLSRSALAPDTADLTLLMANPAVGGSLSIDSYGQILCRAGGPAAMPCFTANVLASTAGTGSSFQTLWEPDDGATAPVQVFKVGERGQVVIAPIGATDLALSILPTVATTTINALVSMTCIAGSTAAVLQLTQSGTGDLIRDSGNKFRVQAAGNLNLTGVGAVVNYIPALTVATSLLHTGATLGFYNHAGVAKPAAPVTLADVIAALQTLGLTA